MSPHLYLLNDAKIVQISHRIIDIQPRHCTPSPDSAPERHLPISIIPASFCIVNLLYICSRAIFELLLVVALFHCCLRLVFTASLDKWCVTQVSRTQESTWNWRHKVAEDAHKQKGWR